MHSTPNNVSVKDKYGKLTRVEEGHEERRAEHFKQLLNRNPPTTHIPEADHDLDINAHK